MKNPTLPGGRGVRIAGTGSYVPPGTLTNDDLAKMVDTSDEWITQRTGIKSRHICDPSKEGHFMMAKTALGRAVDDSGIDPSTIDALIVGTVTSEMSCPSTSARLTAEIGATPAAAFDVAAACCGFVYSLNLADSLIRLGRADRIGIVGVDHMSSILDYDDRACSILFGDAAGAAILEATDDPGQGSIYQTMHADGRGWGSLYIPRLERDLVEGDKVEDMKLGCLRMNGREVYKFAVTKFQRSIKQALDTLGFQPDDIGSYICHQSNARIIESAVEKLCLPPERVYINIDRYGNTSAGSVGLCLDEMRRNDNLDESKPTLLVAFGGGMTWASSVWNW